MDDITITRLRRKDGQWSKRGQRLLCTFDMEVCGIEITGCALLQDEDGGLKADGPRGQSRSGNQIRTHIADRMLQLRVARVVAEAYRLSGGRCIPSKEAMASMHPEMAEPRAKPWEFE